MTLQKTPMANNPSLRIALYFVRYTFGGRNNIINQIKIDIVFNL